MVDLVVAASGRPDFTQRRMLRILDELAQQCYVSAEYLPAVLAAGWHLSDMNRTVDRVPTRAETDWLRELRQGQLATAAAQAHEEPALLTAAVAAALATSNQPPRLERAVEAVGALRRHRRCWPHAAAESLGSGGSTSTGRYGHRPGPRGRPAALGSPLRPGRCRAGPSRDAAPVSFRVLPLPKPRPVWSPSV